MNSLAREDDRPTRSEAEQDGVHGEDDRSQMPRFLVHGFEIDFFSSTPRKHSTVFKPDEETAEGHDEAEHPKHEGSTDRPDRAQDRRGGRENTSTNNTTNTTVDKLGS